MSVSFVGRQTPARQIHGMLRFHSTSNDDSRLTVGHRLQPVASRQRNPFRRLARGYERPPRNLGGSAHVSQLCVPAPLRLVASTRHLTTPRLRTLCRSGFTQRRCQ
jgi:hypothetical protein